MQAKQLAAGTCVLLWAWCLLGCVAVPAVQDPPEMPRIEVGDRWTYRLALTQFAGSEALSREGLFVRRVEEVTSDEIHVRDESMLARASEVRRFDRGWNLLEQRTDGLPTRYHPHLPAFIFPLGSKQTWDTDFYWERADVTEPQHLRSENKVSAWEDVTVEAGTFRALRVEVLTPGFAVSQAGRLFPDLKQYGGVAQTYWYAPSAKSFVKYLERQYVNNTLVWQHSLQLARFDPSGRAVHQAVAAEFAPQPLR